MLDLTPIPDPYVVAVVVVASTAPGAVSGLVWACSRARTEWFLPVHVGVMASVVGLAAATFGVAVPDALSVPRLALLLMAGLGVFAATIAAERGVVARVRHTGGYVARQPSPQGVTASFAAIGRTASVPDSARATAGWLVCVAVGEELLYRGVLLDSARLAPPLLASIAIAVSVLLFAAAHLSLGRGNAMTMLALGGAAAAATLLSASVVPAVIGHALYNVRAARMLR